MRCLVLLSFVVATSATLEYSRTHLVDYDAATGNMLFRGNMPTTSNHTFALDMLLSFMRNRSAIAGLKFPDNGAFTLYDVSLNNDLDALKVRTSLGPRNAPRVATSKAPVPLAALAAHSLCCCNLQLTHHLPHPHSPRYHNTSPINTSPILPPTSRISARSGRTGRRRPPRRWAS